MLEEGTINVIVGWISIDKTVQEKGVHGETPIVWRRCILVARSIRRVFSRIARLLVRVKIVVNEGLVVRPCYRGRREERKQRTYKPPTHVQVD